MNKNRILCIILVFLLLFCIQAPAYADPFGFDAIAAAAYALGQDFGFTFAFTNGAAASVQSQMENALETWAEPRGGINVFGLDPVKAVAGKLAVTQMAANAIMMFLQDFKETYNVLSNTEVFPGTIEGGNIREYYDGYGNYGGRGFRIVTTYTDTGFSVALEHSIDGGDWENDVRMSQTNSYTIGSTSYRFLRVNDTEIRPELRVVGIRTTTGYENVWTYNGQRFTPVGGISSIGKASATDFAPTVLNPTQEWQGDIGADPDTNLDQLIGQVFEEVADTNLDVEGEIVETAPLDPGIDEIIGGIDDIGDTLDGIGSGVEDIASDVGDVSGTVEGINEQVGEISNTLSDALTPPSTDEITQFKFDLRELFPFCIPFDIYRLLSSFDAEPQAPHIQLPIVIDSINFRYNLDLDFSAWDPVAQAMRTAELIVYAIGLAWATGKVIKW